MSDSSAIAHAMRALLASAGAHAQSVHSGTAPRMHHLEAGAGGEVIVLLHGGTGGGANWFRILPLLSPRYRVLAPDFPGFGLSERVEPVPPMGVVAADVIAGWLDSNG